MAATIFTGLSNLRQILNTETDGSSPITRTLFDAMRYMGECLQILTYSTGDTGTVTGISGATLTDTGQAWDADEHNIRTLLMTSGAAVGNFYTIDDTTATTLVCTGDDLEADGVAVGDTFAVFFDLITHASGHTHDNVNSASVVLADAQVTQAKLKTSTGSVSTSNTSYVSLTLPGGEYGFYPRTRVTSSYSFDAVIADAGGNTSAATLIEMKVNNVLATAYASQRYVTSSGEIHWIFYLKEKATGKIISSYEAPDHPCMGNGNRPLLVPHPFPGYNKQIHDIIVINPTTEQVKDAIARTIPIVGGGYLTAQTLIENRYEVDGTRPERALLEVFEKEFEIIESKNADWPDIPITVGLPKVWNGKIVGDYRFKAGELVTPIRVPIEKPDYITPLEMRLKNDN